MATTLLTRIISSNEVEKSVDNCEVTTVSQSLVIINNEMSVNEKSEGGLLKDSLLLSKETVVSNNNNKTDNEDPQSSNSEDSNLFQNSNKSDLSGKDISLSVNSNDPVSQSQNSIVSSQSSATGGSALIKNSSNSSLSSNSSKSSRKSSNSSPSRKSSSSNSVSGKSNSRSSSPSSRKSRSSSPANSDVSSKNSHTSSVTSSKRSRSRSSSPANSDVSSKNSHTTSSVTSSKRSRSRSSSPSNSIILSQTSKNSISAYSDTRSRNESPANKCSPTKSSSPSRSQNSFKNDLQKSKRHAIIDDDSDNENNSVSENISQMTENESIKRNDLKKEKFSMIIDSDSAEEIETTNKSKILSDGVESDNEITNFINKYNNKNGSPDNKNKKNVKKLSKKKKFDFMDSESEDENLKNKKDAPVIKIKKKKKLYDFMDTESEEEGNDENDEGQNSHNRISQLVDSDSENESPDKNTSSEYHNKKSEKKGNKSEKRTGSSRAAKDAAMLEIHSETQRLLRESEISLPYHRPKQRSLQDFLNRKKLSREIPKNGFTTALQIKMFPEIVNKVVVEKEKEAETFYKSSDSEEESTENLNGNQNTIQAVVEDNFSNIIDLENPQNENLLHLPRQDSLCSIDRHDSLMQMCRQDSLINVLRTRDTLQIGETQKISQNDVQNVHNKREHLQQRSLGLGVPKKLFLDEENGIEDVDEEIRASEKVPNEDENLKPDGIELVKKKIEVKTSLKDYTVPRKLFSASTEVIEDMEIDRTDSDLLNPEDTVVKDTSVLSDSENVADKSGNKTVLENSTEDFVLNLSEPETEIPKNKNIDDTDGNNVSVKNHDDNIMIAETPIISNKEFAKSNNLEDGNPSEHCEKVSGNQNTTRIEDTCLQDEIKDTNVLRHDFGLAPSDDDEDVTSDAKNEECLNIKENILKQSLKLNPVIQGAPGSIIDFSDSEQLSDGVKNLMSRFSRHVAPQKLKNNEIGEITVVHPEITDHGLEIVEEVLTYKKNLNEKNIEDKPGAKLVKLKEDLRRKITNARNEEWRLKEEQASKEPVDDYKCKISDDELPEEEDLDDEEMEITSESEPEEDDVVLVDKKRNECPFADEEAEESDAVDDDEENEENEDVDLDNDNEDEDEENSSGTDNDADNITENKPRKLKRIIAFNDDNDDSIESLHEDSGIGKNILKETKTDEDMFALDLPPVKNFNCEDSRSLTPVKSTNSNNLFNLVSPVTQLTALNSFVNYSKESAVDDNSDESNEILLAQKNSSSDVAQYMNLPKNLFVDSAEPVNDNILMDICSGKFDKSPNCLKKSNETQNNISDSQLFEICSGKFPTQTVDNNDTDKSPFKEAQTSNQQMLEKLSGKYQSQVAEMKELESPLFKRPERDITDSQIIELCSGKFLSQKEAGDVQKEQQNDDLSQEFQLSFDSDSLSLKLTNEPDAMPTKSATVLDETKIIDSQFPLTFSEQLNIENTCIKNNIEATNNSQDTGIKDITNTTNDLKEPEKPWSGFRIASSSSEDEENLSKKSKKRKKKFKKKKAKALDLSDDDEEKNEDEDGLSVASEFSEEDEEEFIDYDSEENEVIVPAKDIKKVAGNFLEQEAELSESEWGSEDEDEKGLDRFEYEEGDADQFDEKQVKDQLERIHMKQLMDEDQREVKNLQEILFEDGDLHTEGAGRERKFRWKNINEIDSNSEIISQEDNPDGADDDVDVAAEIQLRKMRYEQQKLQEELEKNNVELLEDNLDEGNFGLKIISARSVNKTATMEESLESTIVICNKKKFAARTVQQNPKNCMRGSFLARGEATLGRIAQNLQDKSTLKIAPLNRKKNFVFEHISPSVSKAAIDLNEETDETPDKKNADRGRKRKILASNTPRTAKKMKPEERKTGKKLF